MTSIPSSSCLPAKRTLKPNSRTRFETEIPRLNLTGINGPTIKKALAERANFYRRKLSFYETMQKLDVSMTTEEMSKKI